MDSYLEDLHKNLKANLEQADSAETILSQQLNTDPEHILQSVVNEMKAVTKRYSKVIREQRKDKQAIINKKIEELTSIIDCEDSSYQIKALETELQMLRDETLQEEASVYRNFHLLNDCKITPEFLMLEKRNAGYCNIIKLTS